MATFTLFFSEIEIYNNVSIDRLKSILKTLLISDEDLSDFLFMNNKSLKVYEGDFFNLDSIEPVEMSCTILSIIKSYQ
jgi:hypothetical protein